MNTSTALENKTCFQFKASFSPCTIFQIIHYDLDAIAQQLAATIARAPNIFLGTPVVIDLEKLKSDATLDFLKLKQALLAAGLAPMGVRGGSPEQMLTATAVAGLPVVTIGKSATTISLDKADSPVPTRTTQPSGKIDSSHSSAETEKVPLSSDKQISAQNNTEETSPNRARSVATEERSATTKLVTHPIRSGMQVYAKEADLIVVSQVSPGAELLSDGHIHVYGPLRGRALAGLLGDTKARIFCRTLEAELVSIAGFYLTKEDMQTLPQHDGMIQIYLENEQVKIEAL